MSATAMAKAWADFADPGLIEMGAATKVVYLALADVANDSHGYELWMGMGQLATKVGLNRTTCTRALADLVSYGVLAVIDDRPGKPVKYRMMVGDGSVTTQVMHPSPGGDGSVTTRLKEQERTKPPLTPPPSPRGATTAEPTTGAGRGNGEEDPDNPRLPAHLEAQAQRELAEAVAAGGVRNKTRLLAAIRRRLAEDNLSENERLDRRRRRLAESEAQLERQRAAAAQAVGMPAELRDRVRRERGPKPEEVAS